MHRLPPLKAPPLRQDEAALWCVREERSGECCLQPVWVSQEAAEREIEFRAARRRRAHVLLIYSYGAGVGSASAQVKHAGHCRW